MAASRTYGTFSWASAPNRSWSSESGGSTITPSSFDRLTEPTTSLDSVSVSPQGWMTSS